MHLNWLLHKHNREPFDSNLHRCTPLPMQFSGLRDRSNTSTLEHTCPFKRPRWLILRKTQIVSLSRLHKGFHSSEYQLKYVFNIFILGLFPPQYLYLEEVAKHAVNWKYK